RPKRRENAMGAGEAGAGRAALGGGTPPLQVVGSELREGVGRGFFETGEPAAKDEAHFVGRAVALLGDLDFGLVALFRGGIHLRPMRAIDEHDDVGVLLDGAGFAEIGELRATFFALGSTSKLA